MEYSELIDLVRARAGLSGTGEARTAVVATLEAISGRLSESQRSGIAERLPGQLREALTGGPAGDPELGAFLHDVAARSGCAPEQARYRAQATLSVLSQAEPEIGRILADALPAPYRELLQPIDTTAGAGTVPPTVLDRARLQHILDERLPDWEADGSGLHRTISLPAENLRALIDDHIRPLHPRLQSGPEISVDGDTATITLQTRSVGRVTEDDVTLAGRIEQVISEVSPVVKPS